MIMQLQLDIRESRGNGQHKVEEEHEALSQGHGRTKRDSHNLKEATQHGHQIQKII